MSVLHNEGAHEQWVNYLLNNYKSEMNFSETMQPSEENDQEGPFQVLIQFTHGLDWVVSPLPC